MLPLPATEADTQALKLEKSNRKLESTMTMTLKKATIGNHAIVLEWDKQEFLRVIVYRIETMNDGTKSFYKVSCRYFGNLEKEAKRSFAYYVRKYKKESGL